jgi:hypothetical protein
LKPKKNTLLNIAEKRFRRKLKSKEKQYFRNKGHSFEKEVTKEQFRQLSLKHLTAFSRFFIRQINVSNNDQDVHKAPRHLSFIRDHKGTSEFFNGLYKGLFTTNESLTLDFKKCQSIGIGAGTFLQILLSGYSEFQDRYNKNKFSPVKRKLSIRESKFLRANKTLFALDLIESFKGINKLPESSRFLWMGLKTGLRSRASFRENIKGRLCNDVIDFINETMRASGFELDEHGENLMGNMMGEILGNAEDHSKLNNFYVNGISYVEETELGKLVELNLAIVNFGYSIYKGFQDTQDANKNVYDKMTNLFKIHAKQTKLPDKNFSTESLYTLYALQEGISRLKYAEPSRGNGTMNFIRSFINLGALGDDYAKYKPKLHIISGHTVIECTNDYQPYEEDDTVKLSLNKSKDLTKLPDRSCIHAHDSYFPGTILQVKVFMSKDHFLKIITKDE